MFSLKIKHSVYMRFSIKKVVKNMYIFDLVVFNRHYSYLTFYGN